MSNPKLVTLVNSLFCEVEVVKPKQGNSLVKVKKNGEKISPHQLSHCGQIKVAGWDDYLTRMAKEVVIKSQQKGADYALFEQERIERSHEGTYELTADIYLKKPANPNTSLK